MRCSCHMGPLRTFFRGLAQVHRLEGPRTPLRFAAPPSWQGRLVTAQQVRGFHESKPMRNDAEDPSGTPKEESTAPKGPSPSTTPNEPSTPSKEYRSKHKQFTERPRSSRPYKQGERRFGSRPNRDTDGKPSYARSDRPRPKTEGRSTSQTQGDEGEEPVQQKPKESWREQKEALKKKFPDGWNPRKRLSPDALAGIRALNAQFPDIYTSRTLSEKFEVSPENIRRILKSKWQPSPEEEQARQDRWHRRGLSVWERKAALGVKPPKRWREEGITRDPAFHERRRHAMQREREIEEEEVRAYREYRENLRKSSGTSD